MGEMEIVFWTFVFLSIYPYAIYPGVVWLASRALSRPWEKGESSPSVTLIISVYNEEGVIEEKVRNALSLDYPSGLVQILVVSDGSTDRTNEIVSGFKDARLVLKAFAERSGKTACLNRVIPEAMGDVVLFTDANAMFHRDILSNLVRSFSDPAVGLVTGWTKYVQPGEVQEATGAYSKLEKMTKYWESLISSCAGADGAIFAIRKSCYRFLDNEDINDFVTPLHVVSQGKRVVLDPEVFCIEAPTRGETNEYRRQARITNRTLRAIFKNPGLLNPVRYGLFSFFLLSHKLLRFLVPFFAAGAFLVNLSLLKTSSIYIAAALLQASLTSLGVASTLGKAKGRLANTCKFFLITLSAQFTGWVRRVRGVTDTAWTPQR